MPLDLGGISGDLTNFSSTNGALRAVKGTVEGNESLVGLTGHRSKSLITKSTFLHRVENHLEAPTPLDRGGSSLDLTNFSSTNGSCVWSKGLRRTVHRILAMPNIVASPPLQRTTNTVLHCVELT